MNRGGKRKTYKKSYKKKNNRKYRKYKKSSSSPNTSIQFIKKVKKVINKTLHPEKKRYNCLRVSNESAKNINWALNGITVSSLDTNTDNPVSSTNVKRSPWQWYQLNLKPVLASSDTFYSMEGSKVNLKYIYLKGYVNFRKLNNNNASALEVLTRTGNLRLRIAVSRGDTMNATLLNKYDEFYDNVEIDTTNKKNGIKLLNDMAVWNAYHLMTRKQYAYKNLKIWTARQWKWNRWNKAQSALGPIANGSGTIVPHADTGGDELMIPFTYVIRINKNIIYKQTTNNSNDGDDDCNLKYFYCFESDCGVENLEYGITLGAVGVFTDS